MNATTERAATGSRPPGFPAAEAFEELCAGWRRMGAWLSLWGRDGAAVQVDEGAPRFWTSLWNTDGVLRTWLGAIARREHDGGNETSWVVAISADCPGVVGVVIPLRQRRQATGVCIACCLTEQASDEDAWRRFCDRHQLDFSVIRELGGRIAKRTATELEALGEILGAALRQAVVAAGRQAELDDLVRSLDSAYEEINLQYRLSGELSLSAETEPLLERVARECLPVCRARGVAFLVTDSGGNGDSAVVASGVSTSRMKLVTVGCEDAPPDEVRRLANQILEESREDTKLVIHNDAAQIAELAWASGWLRHVAALPMQHRRRRLGVLLAINCVDDGDFTSVEVQLLRSVADRVASFLHKQRLYDDLSELLLGLLDSLINSIDAKDPYTCGHSERVAFLSRRLAEAVGLGPFEAQRVYLAGLLHDIGKIGVPDAILIKPGKLTGDEYTVLKQHPEIGARILSKVPHVQDLLPGVLHHHERVDGRGYPHGLAGSKIPRLARILCLADSLDAMTTTRTYRSFLPARVAISEVRRCAGTQFDPQLAEVLLGMNVPALLAEAHEFAGSTLPSHDAASGMPTLPGVRHGSFASRPIFTREMFAAQVTQW